MIMIRQLTLLVLIAISASTAQAQTPSNEYLRSNPKFVQSFRDVVKPVLPSTVRVRCEAKDTCVGVVVGDDGWILTKAHELFGKVTCKLNDGRELDAKIVGVHEQHDLAILKIAANDLPTIRFADTKKIKAGAWVASVGVD